MNAASGPSVRGRALAQYYEQMAALQNAGLPIGRTFDVMAEQTGHGGLRRFSRDAAKAVAAGQSLRDIFGAGAELFGAVDIHLIAAAEVSGRLPATFAMLARQAERAHAFRTQFIHGLLYPAVLAHFAVFVLPVRHLISGELGAYLLSVLGILVPVYGLVGVVYGLWRWSRRESGASERLDAVLIAAPFLGSLVRRAAVARFCRSCSGLMAAGVPVRGALELSAQGCGNHWMRRRLQEALPAIDRGEGLSRALASRDAMPRPYLELLQTGEQTGELVQMLQRAADLAEDEFATSLKRLSVVIPFLVYLIVVLFVALAIVRFYLNYFGQIRSAGGF